VWGAPETPEPLAMRLEEEFVFSPEAALWGVSRKKKEVLSRLKPFVSCKKLADSAPNRQSQPLRMRPVG
jgi:hypothetical protein